MVVIVNIVACRKKNKLQKGAYIGLKKHRADRMDILENQQGRLIYQLGQSSETVMMVYARLIRFKISLIYPILFFLW